MTIGYIICAHTQPGQLVRLVRRLRGGGAHFYIHVDKRVPGSVMREVERDLGLDEDVRLLPRHRCYWASFSLVEAVLEGVEALLADPVGVDYGVLLTGQDYPLRPAGVIERRLEEAGGRSFLSHWPSAGRFLARVEQWHFNGELGGRRVRVPNRLLPLRIGRTLPVGLEAFTGSAHWCLSRESLELVAGLLNDRPEVGEFFRRSAVPDESFFQTILLSSPLAPTIVNDDLRYIDWSGGGDSPRVLTVDDLGSMLESGDLFARKFDPEVDARVLDELDAAIDARAQPARLL